MLLVIQNPNTSLPKAIDQLTLEPLHFNRLFRLEGADEKWNLVTETLLVEKTLA